VAELRTKLDEMSSKELAGGGQLGGGEGGGNAADRRCEVLLLRMLLYI
jgi:hypothetical protein